MSKTVYIVYATFGQYFVGWERVVLAVYFDRANAEAHVKRCTYRQVNDDMTEENSAADLLGIDGFHIQEREIT